MMKMEAKYLHIQTSKYLKFLVREELESLLQSQGILYFIIINVNILLELLCSVIYNIINIFKNTPDVAETNNNILQT